MRQIQVGDHVRDREKDKEMIVVKRIVEPADEHEIDENNTVADYNPGYPEDDRVIGCVFPKSQFLDLSDGKIYPYPRSRVEIVHRPSSD